MRREVTLVMLGVLLLLVAALVVSCSKTSPTQTSTSMTTTLTRQQADALPTEVWGPIANGVSGIRVDGTEYDTETGEYHQLYFFIGNKGDTLGLSTDINAVARDCESYWSPK